jgi:hypothetical protein
MAEAQGLPGDSRKCRGILQRKTQRSAVIGTLPERLPITPLVIAENVSEFTADKKRRMCMKTKVAFAGGLAVIGLFAGCETIPPGAERGPNGTMAYLVQIDASEPGVRIEANRQFVGTTPLTLKIFGDPDGTFHDFGSDYYIIQAFPLQTNQFVQTATFGTGHLFGPEDRIPRQIHFDMNQPPPAYPASAPNYYGPPGYYGPPVYFGPRIYFGPAYGGHWRRHW